MFKGSVNFKAAGAQIAFEPVEIATHVPKTTGATLVATADGIKLKVEVEQTDSTDEAIRCASQAAGEISKVLTFYFEKPFANFNLVDHSLVEESPDSGPVHYLGTSIGMFVKADYCLHLSPNDIAQLKSELDKPHHPGYLFYDQFRAALSLGDPLAKFMSVYNIVLSLSNDSQEDVDILAIQLDGSTPTSPPFRPRRSGTPETVYTRLRNQVGHIRAGTTIESTREEMETWLPGLIKIAKHLINRLS